MSGSAPRRASVASGATPGAFRTQRPWVAFCARCGLPPAAAGEPAPNAFSRVCRRCGMGLVLRAPYDAAPQAGDAFVVVDRGLSVCAVSESAEVAFGVSEPFAIGRLVSELVVPDRPHTDGTGLLSLVRRAVLDGGPPARAGAHVAGIGPHPVTVRVGPCGPPRAALLVLEP